MHNENKDFFGEEMNGIIILRRIELTGSLIK